MADIDKALDAFWTEMERQERMGQGYPFVDKYTSVIDGGFDDKAALEAVLTAVNKEDKT